MRIEQRQRVFLALRLPKPVLRGIQAFRAEHRHLQRSGFRWLPEENLHITLFFLGDVLTEEMTRLCDDLRSAAIEFPHPILRFEGFSVQPARRPRMIWARYESDDVFSLIAQRAAKVCQPYLLSRPQRYKRALPHITLARINKPPEELSLEPRVLLPQLTADHAELWLSRLDRGGASYTRLASFNFSGV
jgi:2'-5' RNA ligase